MSDDDVFGIEVAETGPIVRARLRGSLDGATLDGLLAAVGPLADVADGVVLDCADLTFCDSMGLRGFVTIHNALGARGALVLDGAQAQLRQVLRITGLEMFVASDAEAPPP